MSASRVLSLHRTIVTPAERDRFFERARHLRSHYAQHQCRYWVFEESELTGAFIEFAEAGDPAVLTGAIASAPDQAVDPARIYQEVEL